MWLKMFFAGRPKLQPTCSIHNLLDVNKNCFGHFTACPVNAGAGGGGGHGEGGKAMWTCAVVRLYREANTLVLLIEKCAQLKKQASETIYFELLVLAFRVFALLSSQRGC